MSNPETTFSAWDLGTKGLATTTGLHRIGIRKLKTTPNQGIAIIQRQTIEIEQTAGIAHNPKPILVKHVVIGADILWTFKIHHVRHPGTAPLPYPHSQAEVFPLLLP
jgi:hypothetical protein